MSGSQLIKEYKIKLWSISIILLANMIKVNNIENHSSRLQWISTRDLMQWVILKGRENCTH